MRRPLLSYLLLGLTLAGLLAAWGWIVTRNDNLDVLRLQRTMEGRP